MLKHIVDLKQQYLREVAPSNNNNNNNKKKKKKKKKSIFQHGKTHQELHGQGCNKVFK